MNRVSFALPIAAERLGVTRRQLVEWLRTHPFDAYGQPFFGLLGRSKLFTEDDLRRITQAIREGREWEKKTNLHKKREYLKALELVRTVQSQKLKTKDSPFVIGPGFIYFIEAGDYIKIGFSTSIEKRLPKLRTGIATALVILHVEPGTIADEKELHQRFAQYRAKREWFYKGALLLEYIEERKCNQRAAMKADIGV